MYAHSFYSHEHLHKGSVLELARDVEHLLLHFPLTCLETLPRLLKLFLFYLKRFRNLGVAGLEGYQNRWIQAHRRTGGYLSVNGCLELLLGALVCVLNFIICSRELFLQVVKFLIQTRDLVLESSSKYE